MWEIIIASILAIVGSVATAAYNNSNSKKREEEARQQNYEYNEMAAENADTRGRNLYNDLQSPMAQVNQLKEAGLSPSLLGDRISSQGASTGAMGNGSSGISPSVFGMGAPNDLLQMRAQQAQIENVEADTKKKQAETRDIEGETAPAVAKMAQIYADANMKEASKSLIDAQKTQQDFTNWLNEQTGELQIEKLQNYTNKLYHEAEKFNYEASSAKVQANVDQASETEYIQQVKNDTKKQVNEIILLGADKELTDEQTRKIWSEIEIAWQKLEADQEQARAASKNAATNRIAMWKQAEQFEKSLTLANEQFKWGVKADVLKCITQVVAAGAFMCAR